MGKPMALNPATIVLVANKAVSRKIHVIDAPISGGVSRAQSGELTITAGGDIKTIDQARPGLESIGKRIFYTGEVGNGELMKKDIDLAMQSAREKKLSLPLASLPRTKPCVRTM
jgi:3-hydroxyisobutyrate dehydrogenase-like beta-hydroxyacid dehydrogenase